jgi:hypothetical protein
MREINVAETATKCLLNEVLVYIIDAETTSK